jgi:hypothetical protein
MFSRLYLKEKTDEKVVYRYGMDDPDAPSDGEVEFNLKTRERKLLKPATGDDDGWHAQWLVFAHIRRVVQDEGCPENYMIAIG